jgi:tetratricopeptide (TPR) repeat protein
MKFFFITLFIFTFSNNLLAKTDFLSEGIKLYKIKELEKAKFKFEQDIVFNPKSEKSYLYLSKIFNEQKKIELEEMNLMTVLLINPKNEEATFNLAKLKLEESDFKESRNLIEKLLTFCKKDYCLKSENLKKKIENSLKK